MKLLASALVLLSSLFTVTGFSQNTNSVRPAATALFTNYPSAISCKEAELSSILKTSAGQNINVAFSGTSFSSGIVVSNITKHNNLQYLAIKLPGLNNAVLSLSKRIDEKNNTVYVGHIINPKNSDAYELKHNADGTYQFVKMDLDKLLPACSPGSK